MAAGIDTGEREGAEWHCGRRWTLDNRIDVEKSAGPRDGRSGPAAVAGGYLKSCYENKTEFVIKTTGHDTRYGRVIGGAT